MDFVSINKCVGIKLPYFVAWADMEILNRGQNRANGREGCAGDQAYEERVRLSGGQLGG